MNPYVNKVQKADGTTLIDLTTDTAIASDVAQGKYFHLATGERVQGTASGGFEEIAFQVANSGYIRYYNGSSATSSSLQYTDFIQCNQYKKIRYKRIATTASSSGVGMAFYSGNQESDYLSGIVCLVNYPHGGYGDQMEEVDVPAGAKYARFSIAMDTERYGEFSLLGLPRVPTLVTKSITTNGTYDPANDNADGYSKVTVALPAGTAGTPTATKGTVSNHSVSVTPSVTNAGGVISGGTITGTPVTVSASELVSGSETKTANGTYDVTNLASLVVNVSGGGGASNIVTGTFKGTTTGAAMDVTLNYTGSGYPIAILITPADGALTGTYYSTVKRYAVGTYSAIKSDFSTAPTYNTTGDSSHNEYCTMYRYKSSSSNATSMTSVGSSNTSLSTGSDASGSAYLMVRIKSKTTLSVYIQQSSSYGVMANIDYKYWVIYSS